MRGWPIAGLLACELYMVWECTCSWHQSDQLYLFLANFFYQTHVLYDTNHNLPPRRGRGNKNRIVDLSPLPPLTTHILCPIASDSLPDSPGNAWSFIPRLPVAVVNNITFNQYIQGRIDIRSHIPVHSLSSTAVRFCSPQWGLITSLMRLHKTRSSLDRSIPRSLQRWGSTKSSISQLTFFSY